MPGSVGLFFCRPSNWISKGFHGRWLVGANTVFFFADSGILRAVGIEKQVIEPLQNQAQGVLSENQAKGLFSPKWCTAKDTNGIDH